MGNFPEAGPPRRRVACQNVRLHRHSWPSTAGLWAWPTELEQWLALSEAWPVARLQDGTPVGLGLGAGRGSHQHCVVAAAPLAKWFSQMLMIWGLPYKENLLLPKEVVSPPAGLAWLFLIRRPSKCEVLGQMSLKVYTCMLWYAICITLGSCKNMF